LRRHTLADVGADLREQVDERAGARSFARLERGSSQILGRSLAIEPHQDLDRALVIVLDRGEVGCAQPLAGHLRAQRFDDRERGFYLRARLAEIVEIALEGGEIVSRHGFAAAVSYRLPQRQGLIVEVERFLPLAQTIIGPADIIESRRLPAAIANGPPE